MSQPRFDRLMLADFLPPDTGALGQYMVLFARRAAAAGQHVCLIGLTLGATSHSHEQHGQGSLTVHRLAVPSVPRHALRRRIIWALQANYRLLRAAVPAMLHAKAVWVCSSPPLLGQILVPLGALLRRRMVYVLADLYPEVLAAHLGGTPLWMRPILVLERFWRRRVAEIRVFGEDQRAYLVADGCSPAQVIVQDGLLPITISPADPPLPRPPEAEGHVVLLYSGTMGLAHDWLTIAHAYRRHHLYGSGRVWLWLVGSGAHCSRLAAFLRAENLPFSQASAVALDALPGLLAAADAHLVTLAEAFTGLVSPSKIHACLATTRPVLFIGSDRADAARLGRQAGGAFWCVPPGDVGGATAALTLIGERRTPPLLSPPLLLPEIRN